MNRVLRLGARPVWLRYGLAVVSGAVLYLAFPPFAQTWLIWVGLVPLFVALGSRGSLREAFALGYAAGVTFGLLAAWPLTTADLWTGWAVFEGEGMAAARERVSWFLMLIWLVAALWSFGVFWGLFALSYRFLAQGKPLPGLVLGPLLWVLISEWLRVEVSLGGQLLFLSHAVADHAWLRQLAAYGGVWILSVLVIVTNIGITALFSTTGRSSIQTAGIAALAVVAGNAVGAYRLHAVDRTGTNIDTAVVQYHRDEPSTRDYLPIGVIGYYPSLIEEILQQRPNIDLIVMPESIGFGAVSLDGSRSVTTPDKQASSIHEWEQLMRQKIGGQSTLVVHGMETIEAGKDFNSLLMWDAQGLRGVYHKRRLVPFAENRTAFDVLWKTHGSAHFHPGLSSQLIEFHGLRIGAFICQEVLFPDIIRQSVRDGAQMLVSGGNDGVFGSPAVARHFADIAQLRAVETGRAIARAMKTGISAVIDATGEELSRSRGSENAVLLGSIIPRDEATPYTRFGDWVIWLAALVVGFAAFGRADRRRLKLPEH